MHHIVIYSSESSRTETWTDLPGKDNLEANRGYNSEEDNLQRLDDVHERHRASAQRHDRHDVTSCVQQCDRQDGRPFDPSHLGCLTKLQFFTRNGYKGDGYKGQKKIQEGRRENRGMRVDGEQASWEGRSGGNENVRISFPQDLPASPVACDASP